MNTLERLVHRRLEQFPRIKTLITRGYQRALGVLPYTEVIPDFVMSARGCFYGFHDKSPWSADAQHLLAHRTMSPPGNNTALQIGVVAIEDGQFRELGKTSLWSTQQGSELQWCGKQIWYNDKTGSRQTARVIDRTGQALGQYELPVAAIDPAGSRFASYCFARLARSMAGYGYADPALNAQRRATLLVCDTSTGMIQTVFEAPQDTPTTLHVISHTVFSPDGRYLSFYLRKTKARNLFTTQFFVVDTKHNTVKPYPDVTDCSHYTWIGDNEVFAYCRASDPFDWAYRIVEIDTQRCRPIASLAHLTDGHPQYCHATNTIVSDSYPDRQRLQSLYVFDLERDCVDEIARLRIPMQFIGAQRCDFHPRWSHDGRLICIDTAHSGERALTVVRAKPG